MAAAQRGHSAVAEALLGHPGLEAGVKDKVGEELP